MPELLTKNEFSPAGNESGDPSHELQKEHIFSVVKNRAEMLASLKPTMSKKLFFALEEKLQKEQNEMEKFLGFQQGREENLSHYTFILDNQYFDQIFLTT